VDNSKCNEKYAEMIGHAACRAYAGIVAAEEAVRPADVGRIPITMGVALGDELFYVTVERVLKRVAPIVG
jgi:hypothetical protein